MTVPRSLTDRTELPNKTDTQMLRTAQIKTQALQLPNLFDIFYNNCGMPEITKANEVNNLATFRFLPYVK